MNDTCWKQVEDTIRAAIDVEASAYESGAFRQPRGVPDAASLLRLALLYGACGLSLRLTSGWALLAGVADLSNPALLGRLRGAADWLGWIAGALLAQRAAVPGRWPGWQLRLIDATALSAPGAPGTEWRLHLNYDLGAARIVAAEVTDAHGGERLSRFSPPATAIELVDAGYAHAKELRIRDEAGSYVIVRIGWNALRLLEPDADERFDLFGHLRTTQERVADWAVRIDDRHPDQAPMTWRLIARRQSAAAAERARRKARANAKRKKKTVDDRTLEAADWILLVTNLPAEAFPASAVLDVYRLRWQVELEVKRLKSLLDFGNLPAKSPDLARCWIFAKLIAVLLTEDIVSAQSGRFPPRRSARANRPLPVASLPGGRDRHAPCHPGNAPGAPA